MFVRVRDKCTFHYDNDNNNTSTEERKKGERKKKKKKNFFLAQWSLRRMRRNGLGNSRGPLLMDMYTQTPMHFSRFFFRYIYLYSPTQTCWWIRLNIRKFLSLRSSDAVPVSERANGFLLLCVSHETYAGLSRSINNMAAYIHILKYRKANKIMMPLFSVQVKNVCRYIQTLISQVWINTAESPSD